MSHNAIGQMPAPPQDSFYYLATPYSKYPGGLDAAFIIACKQTALLIGAGIRVYSPIAHTHPVALHGSVDPYDHAIWLPADKPFMDVAQGLIVCQMAGWLQSVGIAHEIEVFKTAGKPVVYMTPNLVPHELLPKGATE